MDLTEKAVWTVKEEGGRGGRKRDRRTDCSHAATRATVRDEVQRFQEGKKSCGEPWPSSVFTFQLGSGGKISRECCAG